MSKFEPIAIFVKQSEMDAQLSQFNERKDYFQAIVNRYNQSELAEPLEVNDLYDLLNAPKLFILKKVTKGVDFNLGGIKLDDEKAFDLLEKPKGAVELVDYIEASKTATNSRKFFYRHANLFVIVDGLVELDPAELERIKTSFTVYLKTQKEKDIFDLLTSLCESINKLNELERLHHIDEKLFRDLIINNPNTETVSVRPDFLTIYNK